MAVWEVIRDALQVSTDSGQVWLTAGEVAKAVEELVPGTNRGTVQAQLRYSCINDPSKKHAPALFYLKNPLFITDDPTKHGKRYRLLADGERAAFLTDPRQDLEQYSYIQVNDWLNTPAAKLELNDSAAAGALDEVDADEEATGLALLELHLQDYLHLHWSATFPDLELYEGDKGREFTTANPSVGILDFLAVDKAGNFVVIETKRGTPDRTAVGQILSYMGWVRQRLCKSGQEVRGILVTGDSSDRLRVAVSAVPNLSIKTYQIAFTLTDVDLSVGGAS